MHTFCTVLENSHMTQRIWKNERRPLILHVALIPLFIIIRRDLMADVVFIDRGNSVVGHLLIVIIMKIYF